MPTTTDYGTVIDDDTLQAVQALWRSDNATLPALIDRAPQAGRLKPGQSECYAAVACEYLSRESAGTGGYWHDHRKVTITIRGVKAKVVQGLAAVGEIFHRDATLTYPSGERFVRWWPLPGGKLAQDPDTKAAQDIWMGVVEADVWSIRR